MTQAVAQVKDLLRSEGFLVDDDPFPVGAFHLLVLGSPKSNLNQYALSSRLATVLGISNTPLPQNPSTPNLYTFVAYRAAVGTGYFDAGVGDWVAAPFLVGEVEDYMDDIILAVVHPAPVAEEPEGAEALVAAAEGWVTELQDPLLPILIGDQELLDPDTWVFLRVLSGTQHTIRALSIKQVLEDHGANVLAPDEGAVGLFLWGSASKDGSTRVFYRPADGPRKAVEIQEILRSQFPGTTTSGVYTTESLMQGQTKIDLLYRTQSVTSGVGAGIGGVLDVIEKALKAIPYLLWGAVAVGALFLGWQGYKYVTKERAAYQRGWK